MVVECEVVLKLWRGLGVVVLKLWRRLGVVVEVWGGGTCGNGHGDGGGETGPGTVVRNRSVTPAGPLFCGSLCWSVFIVAAARTARGSLAVYAAFSLFYPWGGPLITTPRGG